MNTACDVDAMMRQSVYNKLKKKHPKLQLVLLKRSLVFLFTSDLRMKIKIRQVLFPFLIKIVKLLKNYLWNFVITLQQRYYSNRNQHSIRVSSEHNHRLLSRQPIIFLWEELSKTLVVTKRELYGDANCKCGFGKFGANMQINSTRKVSIEQ